MIGNRPTVSIQPCLLMLLLVAVSPIATLSAHDESKLVVPTRSIVRVVIERQSSAIVINTRRHSGQVVQEKTSVDGFVLDSKGHVVLYVGELGPSMGWGRVHVSVTTREGTVYPAEPVGVDERVSVAVVRAALPDARGLPILKTADFAHFNLVGTKDNACLPSPVCQVAHLAQSWLPFQEVKVSSHRAFLKGCPSQGTVALAPNGQLVGLVARIWRHRYSEKLAFCEMLPARVIQESVDRVLRERGSIPAGWLGVYLTTDRQATIESVAPDSPAQVAGLMPHDIVLGMNGNKLRDRLDLIRGVRYVGAGESVMLDIRRGDADEKIVVKLGTRDEKSISAWALFMPDRQGQSQPTTIRAQKVPLTPLLEIGLVLDAFPGPAVGPGPALTGGLTIKSIQGDSRAERAGFQAGDVLYRINGVKLKSLQDVEKGIGASGDGWIEVQVLRVGKTRTIRLNLKD